MNTLNATSAIYESGIMLIGIALETLIVCACVYYIGAKIVSTIKNRLP